MRSCAPSYVRAKMLLRLTTSGPKRYDYVAKEDGWIYSRDQRSLGSLLNEELSKAFGRDIDLGVDQVTKLIH